MALTRRAFLQTGAISAAALAATACSTAPTPPLSVSIGSPPTAAPAAQPGAAEAVSVPPIELIALNRMAYGPRPGDLERVRAMGFAAYVEEQLRPNDADDAECHQRLDSVQLHISYDAGKGYPAVDEMRPLRTLKQPLNELWQLNNWDMDMDYGERSRPVYEVRMATYVRAVYSKWQLREVLAEFWHNHFNVRAVDNDSAIMATWPIYDREVIRKHALGNFRQFLEAVATSPAMLYYLNNAFSKASPANENFARELLELHTMGAMHYLNDHYNRWREVPGALEGQPVGYIDDDVYEAARAFTGWTVANGNDPGDGEHFPNTGEFHYYDGWHDSYQKRFLAVEFDPNQPPQADGRKVLDILAAHPGTAKHLCTKLCRRLVADEPPASLVDRASQVWLEQRDAPDQIAQVVRAILLSPEFASTWGTKVKRPFETVVSFLRATAADFTPNNNLGWMLDERGYRMFGWPAPNGHPDMGGYWLSTNVMLGRWNLPLTLMSDWAELARFDIAGETPASARSARQIADYWANRMVAQPLSEETLASLAAFMAQDGDPTQPPTFDDDDDRAARFNHLTALIAMLPEFQ
nr:DUF1800 domain-containing protein [Chloroflexaceae bacterium]